MNVLLTCAGRRNYLIDYFRQALGARGEVYAIDSCAEASALREADRAFLVPSVVAPDYFDVLYEICLRHQVRLIFSLNDLELPLLARNRERFLRIGTVPVVSAPEVVDRCFDKWETDAFLQGIGVGVPRTFLTLDDARAALARGEISFPLVVKPRWGTASIGLEFPSSEEELELAWRLGTMRLQQTILGAVSAADPLRSLLIQERLSGEEYGLDVVNDLHGRHVTTFVKKKLAMRCGETDRAITMERPDLVDLGKRIGSALGHIGNLDCDVFVDGDRVRVLELNPRFGGGYPFSHAAGGNLPAALVAWAGGEDPRPEWLRISPGVLSAKCDRLVTFNASCGISEFHRMEARTGEIDPSRKFA